MKNKVLAMLLALCMVMSLLPVSVFATGDENTCSCGCAYATCSACTAATAAVGTEGQEGYVAAKEAECGCVNEEGAAVANCCECETCVNNEEEEVVPPPSGDEEEEVFTCGCTSGDCNSVSHSGDESACINEVEADGDTCRACEMSIAAAQAEAAAATRDCSDENQSGSDNCKNTEHVGTCPKKCGEGDECTKTKGHSGDHNNTTCLAGAAGCGASTHDANCPKYVKPAAAAGKDNAVAEVEKTVTLDGCLCASDDHNSHDDCEGGQQVTVTVKVEYEWDTVDEEGKDLTAAQIAAKKAEKKAEAEATVTDDVAKAQAAKVAVEAGTCAKCKAANEEAAAEAAEAAKADLEKCTRAISCPALENHYDDCLSQCTMDSDCDNTVGDSAAHKVQYEVYVTSYNAVLVGGQTVRRTVKDAATGTGITWDSLEDAKAYASSLKTEDAATDEGAKQVQYGYSIRALHCPQAKVPDGVVVNEAGEVVAAPAETPEKPTKAEEFTDMEDWMAEGVQFALDNGLMEGLGNGKFDGRTKVDAITVATVFARMAGETITGASWKDDAKAWVEDNAELFEGIDLEGGELARKDVVLVMWRQAGKPEPSADFELEFTDVEGLEGDHLTAMKWAAESGIVKGNGDGTANPDGGVSRGELCILLSRSASKSEK